MGRNVTEQVRTWLGTGDSGFSEARLVSANPRRLALSWICVRLSVVFQR